MTKKQTYEGVVLVNGEIVLRGVKVDVEEAPILDFEWPPKEEFEKWDTYLEWHWASGSKRR